MRLNKIYTKIGDNGKTMLADGSKVDKFDSRIDAYGDVDELNSLIGLLTDKLSKNDLFSQDISFCKWIQNRLFDIGGELATPQSKIDISKQQVIRTADIEKLERYIDEVNELVGPLENFVLPGGNESNSLAHVARCVCRRAERNIVRFNAESNEVRSELAIFINRLSDWLFVFSRKILKNMGIKEHIWSQIK